MTFKIFAVILLILGEALSIYAELIGARFADHQTAGFVFLKMLALIIFAGAFLVAGYMLGYASFRNIWVVSVASITPILILEPILAYAMFHELPSRGSLIGLVLGAVGFGFAIFF